MTRNEKETVPDKAVFGREVERLCRPWGVTASRELKADYWSVLSDIPITWLEVGATQLLKYRTRNQGMPTPGDWRLAAESCRTEHRRQVEQASLDQDPPVTSEEARAFIESLKGMIRKGNS
jgi:hypothetical protein